MTLNLPAMRNEILALVGVVITALFLFWGSALSSRSNAEAARAAADATKATAEASVKVAIIQGNTAVTVAKIQAHAIPLDSVRPEPIPPVVQQPSNPNSIASP